MDPNPDEDLRLTLAVIEARLILLDREEAHQRRKAGSKLPEGVYEALEDIGRLEGALDSLKRCWHKDDDNYRKGMMHLSRLMWDLRKKLRENL